MPAPTAEEFAAAFGSHNGQGLRHYLEGRGAPWQVAEDIAQEAWYCAWRDLGAFRGESALTTWVYGIARHILSHYRRHPPEEPLLEYRDHSQWSMEHMETSLATVEALERCSRKVAQQLWQHYVLGEKPADHSAECKLSRARKAARKANIAKERFIK